MRKTLVLIFPGFSEFEITVAMAVVRRRAPAQTVSLDGEMVVSEAGLHVAPTKSIAQVAPEGYAGIVLPGGEDLHPVMDDGRVLELVRGFDVAGKPVAAICAGTIVAARAGLLDGRPYTTSLYRRYREMLGCFPEEWLRREPLVQAGNLITAQGYAFVEFGLRVGRASTPSVTYRLWPRTTVARATCTTRGKRFGPERFRLYTPVPAAPFLAAGRAIPSRR